MIRGPTDQQRTIVLGRTGSGKSQFAIALLSTRNWDEMPWVIIDYKGEDLIDDIRAATGKAIRVLKVTDDPPTNPGLYYMHPRVVIDDKEMDIFLRKCYDMKRGPMGNKFRGHIGLFIDEGYALPQAHGSAFDVILTQGRSLYIPVIVLYQRPVWMSRFAVAQADFVAVFVQLDNRDYIATRNFTKLPDDMANSIKGGAANIKDRDFISFFSSLPPYYCLWYDVGQGSSTVLRPAPSRQEIIGTFQRRLSPGKKRALI